MEPHEPQPTPVTALGRVAAGWGIGGVVLLLGDALARLVPIALGAAETELGAHHWLLLVVWVPLMAYTEGVRGFHRRFAPRVVARAFHLARHPTVFDALLAPIYCMSLYGATPRSKRAAWLLVVGIVSLVLLLRITPQPWRGIIDAGVVVGLGLGTASILVHTVNALRHGPAPAPDLPG